MIKDYCTIHQFTEFKELKNRKGTWKTCHLCLKEKWRKAAIKRRKNPEVMKYQRNYNKSLNEYRKSWCIFLAIIVHYLDGVKNG